MCEVGDSVVYYIEMSLVGHWPPFPLYRLPVVLVSYCRQDKFCCRKIDITEWPIQEREM